MTTLNLHQRTPQLAELKVSYKRSTKKQPDTPFTSVVQAEEFLRSIWDSGTLELREEFVVVCLDASLRVLGWVRLHTGGLDSSPVDPRLVFGIALKCASAGIIVAHNHPSGSVTPSEHDIALTRRLSEGAKLLGIRLVDHLIVTRDDCFSFATAGLMPS